MRTTDFAYQLPAELIAQEPALRRDASRLLVLDRAAGEIRHRHFPHLVDLVGPGDVVVVNDSRVIPARLLARRKGGGRAEVLLVEREGEGEGGGTWRALLRPGSRIRTGERLAIGELVAVEVAGRLSDGERRVRLVRTRPSGARRADAAQDEAIRRSDTAQDEVILARYGHVPLPPYIRREDTPADRERYQTVYATAPGSVAAPTAGLHFTPELLQALRARGAAVATLTLHIGPGTFKPVTAADPSAHRLASEPFGVPPATAEAVNAARRHGRRVWAVGTTVARTLETVAESDGTVRSGSGRTSLFIRPPYAFRAVDRLLTNFHLPRSTLLMLVAAFAGLDSVLAAYREAVARRYRFYSYGDSMAIL